MIDGKKSGPNAEFKFNDGDRFVGDFKEDEFSKGIYEAKDGSRYEGDFKNGKKHGYGKLTINKKIVYQG